MNTTPMQTRDGILKAILRFLCSLEPDAMVNTMNRVELEDSDREPYLLKSSTDERYIYRIIRVGMHWIADNIPREDQKRAFYGDVYAEVIEGIPITKYFDKGWSPLRVDFSKPKPDSWY